MSDSQCGSVRELLPDHAAGRLGHQDVAVVDAHVAGCGECAGELELARLLYASRATVPHGLADRVIQAVRTDARPRQRPWWGISAAAVAALALGIGINADRAAVEPGVIPEFATELAEGDLWSSDDGLVAGAPSIESLSDEMLLMLIEELDATTGGAA